MSRSPETGVCILSIDLTAPGDASTCSSHDLSSAPLDELRHALAEAGIPATWGISGWQAETGRPLVHDGRSEVALLADASWSIEGASRRRFAEGIVHSLAQLSSAGLHPTTLALRRGAIPPYDDLLVKHGIHVVRVGESRGQGQTIRGWWPRRHSSSTTTPMRSLRWGLWEVLAGVDLQRDGVRRARRVVDRLCSQGGLALVVANAALLTSNGRLAVRLISHLAHRMKQGDVRLETLSTVAAGRQPGRQTAGAKSILRQAAA